MEARSAQGGDIRPPGTNRGAARQAVKKTSVWTGYGVPHTTLSSAAAG